MGRLAALASVLVVGFAIDAHALDPDLLDATASSDLNHSDGVLLEIYRSGGEYVLDTSCAGCIVELWAEDWLDADNPRARAGRADLETRDLVLGGSEGASDELSFALLNESKSSIFAIDIVALLEHTTGVLSEKRMTIFGRIDHKGTFSTIDWQTWVCESGKARCGTEPDGSPFIILSEGRQ